MMGPTNPFPLLPPIAVPEVLSLNVTVCRTPPAYRTSSMARHIHLYSVQRDFLPS